MLMNNRSNNLSILEWKQLQNNETTETYLERLLQCQNEIVSKTGIEVYTAEDVKEQWNLLQNPNKKNSPLYGIPCCIGAKCNNDINEIRKLKTLLQTFGAIVLTETLGDSSTLRFNELVPFSVEINALSVAKNLNQFCLKLSSNDNKNIFIYAQNVCDIELVHSLFPSYDLSKCFDSNLKFAVPEDTHVLGTDKESFKNVVKTISDLGILIIDRDFNDFYQLIQCLYQNDEMILDKYTKLKQLIRKRSEYLEPTVLEILSRAEEQRGNMIEFTDYLRKDVLQSFEDKLNGFILPNWYKLNSIDLPVLAFPAKDNFTISLISSKYYERGLIDVVKRYLTIDGKLESNKNFIFNGRINTSFEKIKSFEPFAIKTNSSVIKKIRNMGGIFRNVAKLSNKYNFKKINGTVDIEAACIHDKNVIRSDNTVEIWDISKDSLKNLEADISNISNLIIDKVELENGEVVRSFLIKQIETKVKKPFNCVLIANRGEIAVRIIRTLKRLGIKSIVIYSETDQFSPHVEMADESVRLMGNSVSETYLNIEQIINIAKQHDVEAIIPGYGFLSENPLFVDACDKAGIVFVGPLSSTINDLGLKHTAKEIAKKAGVPLVPGSDILNSLDEAIRVAEKIQYPVMIKSTAGGGGIGIMKCNNQEELISGYETVKKLSLSYFNNDAVYLEKFIDESRHIEVQIFGDGNGNVIALGERDCSLQRRNQKVVEETPAPNISNETRKRIHEAAVNLGKVTKYKCAGTVEFMYEPKCDQFYFLEVNTRLQVEHPVTEQVTGLDLVEWMLLVAANIAPDFNKQFVGVNGSSIEVRLYAENPIKNFVPSPGQLTEVKFPEGARVDTWIQKGTVVSTDFDPLLAKIIVHGRDRSDALQKLQKCLDETQVYGIVTNLDYLRSIVYSEMFATASVTTKVLNSYMYVPKAIEILSPGSYTSVQDYPGRINYWRIGVPPSGPMDNYAFRVANRIVGNRSNAPALEITITGPTILFHSPTVIALTGGTVNALLDDKQIELWSPVVVHAGQKLSIGKLTSGCRSYLAIRDGLDVPEFLGSRSTFALGNTGGYNGRILKFGDVIFMGNFADEKSQPECVNKKLIPNYGNKWEIGVLYGPHGSPDFFQEDSLKTFLASDWKVHYNSNRFGVRLVGPQPTWAREDGGEAGLHPSNTHDYVYALGAINFTGDEPVILTCDGPSLGGFVCPFTVVDAEMWKVGQVKPGDTIRFRMINFDQAINLRKHQENIIKTLTGEVKETFESVENDEAVLHVTEKTEAIPQITYRQAGDRYILIEYGDNVFDIQITYRIYKLQEIVENKSFPEIIEMSPGVRSVLVEYNNNLVSNRKMVQILVDLESKIENSNNWTVPSRIIRLPMAFEDDVTLAAVQRYRETIRSEAPWLPNNVDFITKINKLKDRNEVRNMLYEATFLVLGLGDVFLGAPCAVPLDPRHRLLGSKYNPSRSFTPNGTVGIGGMYMCIYTMESPGGYQLVGRTLPIWDRLTLCRERPWLLTVFDQIQFYPVTQEQLALLTKQVEHGAYEFDIKETIFDYCRYSEWLQQNAEEIEIHNRKLQEGNTEIVELLKVANTWSTSKTDCKTSKHDEFDDSHTFVYCDFVGRVWKQLVSVGDDVHVNQPLIVIEAMKAEITVTASLAGKVIKLCVQNGDFVEAGDIIAVIK